MQFSCNKLNVMEIGCGCFLSRSASNCTERPVAERPRMRERKHLRMRRAAIVVPVGFGGARRCVLGTQTLLWLFFIFSSRFDSARQDFLLLFASAGAPHPPIFIECVISFQFGSEASSHAHYVRLATTYRSRRRSDCGSAARAPPTHGRRARVGLARARAHRGRRMSRRETFEKIWTKTRKAKRIEENEEINSRSERAKWENKIDEAKKKWRTNGRRSESATAREHR